MNLQKAADEGLTRALECAALLFPTTREALECLLNPAGNMLVVFAIVEGVLKMHDILATPFVLRRAWTKRGRKAMIKIARTWLQALTALN